MKKLKCHYIGNYVLCKNNEATTNSYGMSPKIMILKVDLLHFVAVPLPLGDYHLPKTIPCSLSARPLLPEFPQCRMVLLRKQCCLLHLSKSIYSNK